MTSELMTSDTAVTSDERDPAAAVGTDRSSAPIRFEGAALGPMRVVKDASERRARPRARAYMDNTCYESYCMPRIRILFCWCLEV